MSQPETLLSLEAVSKRYGKEEVLSNFSLDVQNGEFFTILGPSGCGKTTVLRLIAGFELPDTGVISIGGEAVEDLPPEKRPVNTVFQNYALFPHMTVAQNVAFGLRMAGLRKTEIEGRVREALQLVKLEGFNSRLPGQLSGGQRQRVAIARSIVMRPKVLLLDESLSALDRKLRQKMQMELKRIQRKSGITFVYVTHDQEEALSMSDRVLVMNLGQTQQIGTPREIYERPASLFVARFIGEINIFDAHVVGLVDKFHFQIAIGNVQKQVRSESRFKVGEKVHLLVRPEDLRIEYVEDRPDGVTGFPGHVRECSYKGKTLDSLIELENGKLIHSSEFFNESNLDFDYRIGQRVWVNWVDSSGHVIRQETD